MEDAVNVDLYPVSPEVFNAYREEEKWYFEDEYDVVYLSHVIEHVDNPLDLMQMMWNVTKADGLAIIRCPHGNSNDAWENPTHVRPMYPLSFLTYSQEYWWKEHTFYWGDWKIESVDLAIDQKVWDDVALTCPVGEPEFHATIDHMVQRHNNIVTEMVARLRAVKPRRVLVKGTRPAFAPVHVIVHRTVYENDGAAVAGEGGSTGGTEEIPIAS